MAEASKVIFIVLSESKVDGEKVRVELSQNHDIEVITVQSYKDVVDKMNTIDVNCLVFNLGRFDMTSVQIVNKLHGIKPSMSTIVTSEQVAKEALKAVRKLKRVVVLDRPLDPIQVDKLVDKIRRGDEIYQRAYERFATVQEAQIQIIDTEEILKVTIHNISQGGSYFQCNRFFPVNSVFKMIIPLDKLSKAHVVFAQVVRVTLEAFGPSGNGIGVRFIDEQEANEELAKLLPD